MPGGLGGGIGRSHGGPFDGSQGKKSSAGWRFSRTLLSLELDEELDSKEAPSISNFNF